MPNPDDPKPASAFTQQRNSAAVVDFDDATDFEAASLGLVAQHPTGLIDRDGWPVWDTAKHDFLRTDDHRRRIRCRPRRRTVSFTDTSTLMVDPNAPGVTEVTTSTTVMDPRLTAA